MKYEYTQLNFNWDDLTRMNGLAADGWKVAWIEALADFDWETTYIALLEREIRH